MNLELELKETSRETPLSSTRFQGWWPMAVLIGPLVAADLGMAVLGESLVPVWFCVCLAVVQGMAAWLAVGRRTWTRRILEGSVVVVVVASHIPLVMAIWFSRLSASEGVDLVLAMIWLIAVLTYTLSLAFSGIWKGFGPLGPRPVQGGKFTILDLFVATGAIGVSLALFQQAGLLIGIGKNFSVLNSVGFLIGTTTGTVLCGSLFSVLVSLPSLLAAKFVALHSSRRLRSIIDTVLYLVTGASAIVTAACFSEAWLLHLPYRATLIFFSESILILGVVHFEFRSIMIFVESCETKAEK